jgi:hypothetical protein
MYSRKGAKMRSFRKENLYTIKPNVISPYIFFFAGSLRLCVFACAFLHVQTLSFEIEALQDKNRRRH